MHARAMCVGARFSQTSAPPKHAVLISWEWMDMGGWGVLIRCCRAAPLLHHLALVHVPVADVADADIPNNMSRLN